jgi:beta-lactamase class A
MSAVEEMKSLTKQILYLSLDPTLRRSIIGGSNQEEDLLHARLSPKYLLNKHYTEIKHQNEYHAPQAQAILTLILLLTL